MASETERLSYIDALRGYAIAGVIVVHVAQYVPQLEWPLAAIATEGARGVQLFFVASALTLMLSWDARADGATAFYIRRIFRIAPMFWLAIVLFVGLYGFAPRGWAPDGIGWPHILVTALFLHGFHPETLSSVVPGGSTIAVEMTFYAVFPLLAVSIRSWQTAALALIGSFVLAGLLFPITIEVYRILTPHVSYDLIKGFSYAWFPTHLPAFMTGFLVFHLLRQRSWSPSRAALDAGAWIAVLVVLGLQVAITSLKLTFAISVLDFGLLAFCLGRGGGRLLVSRPIRYLGTISYSAYFWHFAVLWEADQLRLSPYISPYPVPGWVQFLVLLSAVTILTVILASLSYRLIELPMIRVGRTLAARLATKPIVVPAYTMAE